MLMPWETPPLIFVSWNELSAHPARRLSLWTLVSLLCYTVRFHCICKKMCRINSSISSLWPFPMFSFQILLLTFLDVSLGMSVYFSHSLFFWGGVFVAKHGLSLVAVIGATLRCSAQASHCSGFSCCKAQALGTWASVIVARELSSCSSWALECRLSSCGSRA